MPIISYPLLDTDIFMPLCIHTYIEHQEYNCTHRNTHTHTHIYHRISSSGHREVYISPCTHCVSCITPNDLLYVHYSQSPKELPGPGIHCSKTPKTCQSPVQSVPQPQRSTRSCTKTLKTCQGVLYKVYQSPKDLPRPCIQYSTALMIPGVLFTIFNSLKDSP
jgi:hypothetical protein